MVKTLIGAFELSMSDSFNDTEERIAKLEQEVQESAPFLWATTNNIMIHSTQTYSNLTYSTHVFYYCELTDIQATEHILRFT